MAANPTITRPPLARSDTGQPAAIPSAGPVRRARIPALDAARALAVVAMVMGHTLDALLAPAVRGEPLVALYWTARGFTAPLFMLVAGWAVTAAAARRPEVGLAVPLARLPRILLLLALGYALRWPGWGLPLLRAGDGAVWAHFLAFDALHAIAVAMLVTTLVLALPWSAPRRAAVLLALSLVAVALGTAPLAAVDPSALPRPLPLLALAQAVGGTSSFPLFPWVGYFLVGAMLGLLAADGVGRRALAVAAAGAALVAASLAAGTAMTVGDPFLFAFRAGAVLLLLGLLSLVPEALAARVRWIGRASLAVYVVHLPVVYGWSTLRGLFQVVGQRLTLPEALAAGFAVLAASLLAHRALAKARQAVGSLSAALAARLASADGSRDAVRWNA